MNNLKTIKQLVESFSLYGKITEQHALDIEEIIKEYLKKAFKEVMVEKLKLSVYELENDYWKEDYQWGKNETIDKIQYNINKFFK